MKSHELAKLLLGHKDKEIILQGDSEGNSYNELFMICYDCFYVKDEREYIAYGDEKISDFPKEDVTKCIILIP